MKNWDDLVESYISHCEQRGLSQSTLKPRERTLQLFGLWIRSKSSKIKVKDINEKHVIDYLKSRSFGRAKATVSGNISILKCFGDWLCEVGLWEKNPLKWIERPKIDSARQIPRILNRTQIINTYKETFHHHINYFACLYPAAFSLLYSTGMRRGELLSLRIQDWDSNTKTLKVNGTKTGVERLVPIPKDVSIVFEKYLNARSRIVISKHRYSENLVFLNRNAEPLSGNNLLKGIKAASLRAGVPDFKLHALRHGCASDLLEAGVHISKVQSLLGHSCIESTYRYTHIADGERRKAMDNHPLNEILNGENSEE